MKNVKQKIVILTTLILSIMNVGIAQVGYYEETNSIVGSYSSALGVFQTINGNTSIASGELNTINGTNSGGFGYSNYINGNNSFSLGNNTRIEADGSIIIGSGLDNSPIHNSIPNSLMIGFGSSNPTIFVKEAETSAEFGRVGIGTITPLSLLHVQGDLIVAESANFKSDVLVSNKTKTSMLQVTKGAKTGYILTSDKSGNASWTERIWLELPEDDLCYWGGNIGIGTDQPNAKLDVIGKTKTNELQITNGASDGKILSSDDSGNATWVAPDIIVPDALWVEDNYGNISREDGWVGIGTAQPSTKLEVYGGGISSDFLITSSILTTELEAGEIVTNSMTMNTLIVPGKITTGELEVKVMGKWQDQVFDRDYPLPSLKSVEDYIQKHHHLQNIPSEAEVLAKGYSVGEMDALFLQKIEELTLYILEADKRIVELKEKINELKKK